MDSSDVNDYVREACGEAFTAKDFRTWAGTVLVARALADAPSAPTAAAAKRAVVQAIEAAADRLGNTVAVCRKCYVHPAVVEGISRGRRDRPARRRVRAGRTALGDEAAVARLIARRTRSGRKAAKKAA